MEKPPQTSNGKASSNVQWKNLYKRAMEKPLQTSNKSLYKRAMEKPLQTSNKSLYNLHHIITIRYHQNPAEITLKSCCLSTMTYFLRMTVHYCQMTIFLKSIIILRTAIINNMGRQNEYLLAPTAAKLTEFNAHEVYLLQAANHLNIHSQRIVLNFREQAGYIGCMDTFIHNRRTLEEVPTDQKLYMQETKPQPTPELDNGTNTNIGINYNDDSIAVEINSFFTAISQQMERQKAYMLQPTKELFHDIDEHERYIATAMCDLNVHSHRIIRTFKLQIEYKESIHLFLEKQAAQSNDENEKTPPQLSHPTENEPKPHSLVFNRI
jgi:hypothetical protein